MAKLVTNVKRDFGATYSPTARDDLLAGIDAPFSDSRECFIHGLLGDDPNRRWGTCSTLPVLVTVVARRLGYPVGLAVTRTLVYIRWEGETAFNVEVSGPAGMTVHSDEYYSQLRGGLTADERKSKFFLRKLSPAEEFSQSLLARVACLRDAARYDETLLWLARALQYGPDHPNLAKAGDYLLSLALKMSYDPTVGTWIEADPAEYIDGPNRYRMEDGDPIGLVDPSGLDPTYPTLPLQPPTNNYIQPTGQVSLPGPNEGLNQDSEFYQQFIKSAAWSDSSPDGKGGVATHLLQLKPPDQGGSCNQKVKDAVDKFNDRAQQHEQAYARWLQQQINAGLTPPQIDATRRAYVAQDAGWELSEQLGMYQLLLDAHNATLGDGPEDKLSQAIRDKMKDKAAQLNNLNSTQSCPAEKAKGR